MPVFTTPTLIQGLQAALTDSAHGDLLPLLSEAPSGLLQGSALSSITEAIASRDEALAVRLLNASAMAEAAIYHNEAAYAWRQFTEVIKGAARGRGPAVPVSFGTFKAVTREMLEGRTRDSFFVASLRQLGVPDPKSFLEDLRLRARSKRRKDLYLSLERGHGTNYELEVDDRSFDRKIFVHVTTPLGRETPLGKEDIQLLVARALVLSVIRTKVDSKIAAPYWSVASGDLAKPIPLSLLSESSLISFGRSGPTVGQRENLPDTQMWLNSGARAFALLNKLVNRREGFDPAEAFHMMTNSLLPEKILRTLEERERIHPSWMPLLICPNALKTVFREMDGLMKAPFEIIFEVEPSLGQKIEWSVIERSKKPVRIVVRSSEQVVRELTDEDLVELVWRVSALKDDKVEKEVTLRGLRHPLDLNPEAEEGRAYLRLVFRYHRSRQQMTEAGKVGIEGDLGQEVKRRFASALMAVTRQQEMTPYDQVKTAWEDVIGVRRWLLGESGSDQAEPLVDLTPVDHGALIFVKGDAGSLKAGDWLFVLSAMAANPDHAIRINIRQQFMMLGRQGDAAELYGGIAANRIFHPFGVFDPKARLPENMDMGLPGGIAATENPNYLAASLDRKRAYMRALRWFASSSVPMEWQPAANDGKDEVKAKYRQMMQAWHPDKGGTPEQIRLVALAGTHWKSVFDLSS